MASTLDVTLVTGTSADSVRGLVDALASEQVAVLQTGEPRLVRWGEGCGCCTVREDVVEQLRAVARDPGVKQALLVLPIEDSLEPVVKSFTVADERGRILGDQATLQDLVTVVGADSLSGAVVPRKDRKHWKTSTFVSSRDTGPTSAARKPRSSRASRDAGGCRVSSRRTPPSKAYGASPL